MSKPTEEEIQALRDDPEFMEGIKEGVADIKAGRVYLWEDVKGELGIKEVL